MGDPVLRRALDVRADNRRDLVAVLELRKVLFFLCLDMIGRLVKVEGALLFRLRRLVLLDDFRVDHLLEEGARVLRVLLHDFERHLSFEVVHIDDFLCLREHAAVVAEAAAQVELLQHADEVLDFVELLPAQLVTVLVIAGVLLIDLAEVHVYEQHPLSLKDFGKGEIRDRRLPSSVEEEVIKEVFEGAVVYLRLFFDRVGRLRAVLQRVHLVLAERAEGLNEVFEVERVADYRVQNVLLQEPHGVLDAVFLARPLVRCACAKPVTQSRRLFLDRGSQFLQEIALLAG